ncbi:MAG: outer membrane lipoprotein-sorting protein [Methyloglobulus sp.]|nr:outer membrane lipoprotein-sorting protein [Methyloglobulus sp.]
MIVVRILFTFLLTAMSVVSAAENTLTAKQILQKMVKAMEISNYQGTVVFLKNDKLEAMKYFHASKKNQEQERLVSLNSPQREIIRNSDEVTCLYKLTQQVIVDRRPYEHSFIVDVPKNLDELDTSYQFEVVGEEDVAMLPSYVVAIQPKDDFRYIRKIWIAKEQFLPMKAIVYGLSGVVLEQVVFTEMQFNKQPPSKDKVVSEASKVTAIASELANNASFEVTALPLGFKQIFFSRKPLHQSDQPVDHLLLSDGFASVSVYLESKKANAIPDSRFPEGINSVGAINFMSRSLADSQLTVLGEVPASTVKYISEGVKLRNSAP